MINYLPYTQAYDTRSKPYWEKENSAIHFAKEQHKTFYNWDKVWYWLKAYSSSEEDLKLGGHFSPLEMITYEGPTATEYLPSGNCHSPFKGEGILCYLGRNTIPQETDSKKVLRNWNWIPPSVRRQNST